MKSDGPPRADLPRSIGPGVALWMVTRSSTARMEQDALARARILVLDNDPTISLVIHRVLGAAYDIHDMTDAKEAIALIRGGTRFDAILCDLLMPGLGGRDFYRQLLAADWRAAAGVIFITGAAGLPEMKAFLSTLSNPVLEKPFTRAALRAVVQSVSARNGR